MSQNKMIAMILAGGRGSRLYDLTQKVAKPAVHYGGKYRIIDFCLSNCSNSGIDTVGVLTQYESILLHYYLSHDYWGFDAADSGIYLLPPREKTEGFGLYRGTADAIGQNMDFIDQTGAEYVLILSGDHIYKMNYDKMLAYHKANNASATIAVLEVPLKEASRFGIMNCNEKDEIVEFEEKPAHPKSNLASMGIYIFNWKDLREKLVADEKMEDSHHDFGKDIIPALLNEGKKLCAYRFKGYWKDVGTIESLWEANMDLIHDRADLNIDDPTWRIYTEDIKTTPVYFGAESDVSESLINQGAHVDGKVSGSVLFTNSYVAAGAEVKDSVILPGARVLKGAKVVKAIVDEGVVIGEDCTVGKEGNENVTLLAKNLKGGVHYE